MARLIVWADLEQQELVRETVGVAGLDLVAVGASVPDHARELAAALDAERLDDLRQAVVHDAADIIWIAASGSIEADERRALRERPLCTVSSEPRPIVLADLLQDPDEATTAVTIPLLRRSPVYRAAREALGEFGQVQVVRVECLGRPIHGTLGARLYDAVDLVLDLLGPDHVETIDASVRTAAETAVSGRHGHLTAVIRGERAAASVLASDQAGTWSRSLTLLGPRGTFRLDDHGYVWHDSDGSADEHFEAEPENATPAALLADQLRRSLEQLDLATEPPADLSARLALCEAARLSCRTRQPEAPDNLRAMLERV